MKATFSMSFATSVFPNIITLIVFRATDFALRNSSVFIQILLQVRYLNNSSSFYFLLAKFEAKPSSNNFGFEPFISKPNYLLPRKTKHVSHFVRP